MLALLASLALADTITLDTGAVIEGDLARYELGGDCQVSVAEGPLTGVILIAPCHRVLAFVRSPDSTPRVLAAVAPAAVATVEPAVETPVVEVPLADEVPAFLADMEPVEVDEEMADAPAIDSTPGVVRDDAASGDPPADDAAEHSYGDATVQPRQAPSMPAVTTRPLSF